MSVIKSKLRAFLEVGNPGEGLRFPISSVTASFACNEIPQCQVSVALGRAVVEGSEWMADYDETSIKEIVPKKLARIWGEIEDDDESDRVLYPKGLFIWFDGRIVTSRPQITSNAAAYDVVIQHWLGDLQSSAPMMHYAASYNTTNRVPLSGHYGFSDFDNAAAGGNTVPEGMAAIEEYADLKAISSNPTALMQDVWGNGIKKVMDALLSRPFESVDSDGCEDAINRPQPKTITAFGRIQGPSGSTVEYTGKEEFDGYELGGHPVGFIEEGEEPPRGELVDAVSRAILGRSAQSFMQADVWSQLVAQYCPTFLCRVVPRIMDAMFAPVVPCCKYGYNKVMLTANDIVQLDTTMPMQSSVRTVAVTTGIRGILNLPVPGIPAAVCYPYRNNDFEDALSGKVVFTPAPAIVNNIAEITTPLADIINNQHTLAGITSPNMQLQKEDAGFTDEISQLLQRYAQAQYYEYQFAGNSAKVMSRLRFDIAPGTLLTVLPGYVDRAVTSADTLIEDFNNRNDELDDGFVGLVNRVTIVVDIRRKTGATLLQFSHVRSSKFDADLPPGHPLLATTFLGAPLVDLPYEDEE